MQRRVLALDLLALAKVEDLDSLKAFGPVVDLASDVACDHGVFDVGREEDAVGSIPLRSSTVFRLGLPSIILRGMPFGGPGP